ncbi:MAG: DNA polymerase III subunit beta [Mariprofundales bacterium]|nr:DNA polymerase III subunit beta [Mariprofundales bacterium]
MHIQINRKHLMHSVQRCLNIVDKRVTNPSLANVLLVAKSDTIIITATNEQITIQIRLTGEIIQQGSISIDAKKLHDLLREWSNVEDVDLILQRGRVELRHGRSVMRLNTIDVEEFPQQSELISGLKVTISSTTLSEMIASTQFSIGTDETRKHLTGMLFELSAEYGLRVVSTDGHRLSFCQTALIPSLTIDSPIQVIVPEKMVVEIRRVCEDLDQEIQLLIDHDRIAIVTTTQKITGLLINARYPLYEEVFPKTLSHTVMLPNQEIDTVLRRCLVVANGINHDISLSFADNAVHITAKNRDQEEVDDFVALPYDSTPFTMGFNGGYLRNVLSVISSDQVEMQFNDENSPVLFTEQTMGIDKRFVIMPLRIG